MKWMKFERVAMSTGKKIKILWDVVGNKFKNWVEIKVLENNNG